MVNRILKYNSIFTILLVLSLFMSLIISYYVASLYRQTNRIEKYNKKSNCETDMIVTGAWNYQLLDELDKFGDSISAGTISVIFSAQVEEEKYSKVEILFDESGERDIGCLVGDYWEIDDVVTINGIAVPRIGILETNTLDGEDERVVVTGNMEEIILFCKKIGMHEFDIRYYSIYDEEECKYDFQNLINFCNRFDMNEGEINVLTSKEYGINNVAYSLSVLKTYKIIALGLIIFCVCNALYLMYIWTFMKRYEYSVKRMLGFSLTRIILENSAMLGIIFLVSIISMVVVTYLYEFTLGNVKIWWENIRCGWRMGGLCYTSLLIVMSIVPGVIVRGVKLNNVLRNNE